jgi:hypothetical protein
MRVPLPGGIERRAPGSSRADRTALDRFRHGHCATTDGDVAGASVPAGNQARIREGRVARVFSRYDTDEAPPSPRALPRRLASPLFDGGTATLEPDGASWFAAFTTGIVGGDHGSIQVKGAPGLDLTGGQPSQAGRTPPTPSAEIEVDALTSCVRPSRDGEDLAEDVHRPGGHEQDRHTPERTDSAAIRRFASRVSGIESVGLKAIELVSET